MSINLKRTLIFLLIIYNVFSQNLSDEKEFGAFMKFMKSYGKNYKSVKDLISRYNVFKDNNKKQNIKDLDDDLSNADDFVQGVTQFSDLTEDEFSKQYLTFEDKPIAEDEMEKFDYGDASSKNFLSAEEIAEKIKNDIAGRNLQTTTVPSSWDWRTKGAVTSIKNQGACGSCWAFTTVANLESQYYLKYKSLKTFSEEQLIDCDSTNSGCNGGTVNRAFNYVKKVGGVMLQSSYPYKGSKSICLFSSAKAIVKVKGIVYPGSTDENKIKEMLYKKGPLATAMNASSLQFYKSGIINMTSSQCNPQNLNHAVTLVGYGVSITGMKYWIIKNSWGSYWGESGYFRIKMGSGVCGINRYVSSAVVA